MPNIEIVLNVDSVVALAPILKLVPLPRSRTIDIIIVKHHLHLLFHLYFNFLQQIEMSFTQNYKRSVFWRRFVACELFCREYGENGFGAEIFDKVRWWHIPEILKKQKRHFRAHN